MPTISLNHSMMKRIQELNGAVYDGPILTDLLPNIGCPVESNDEDEIEVEVFPDRPDLLSHETMAKAIRAFTGVGSVETKVEVTKGEFNIKVDQTMGGIRPVIMGAIVRSVNTGKGPQERDSFIQSLMDHQEKLHLTLGRKRSFSSIGVHDLSKLSPPFRYVSVSRDFSFTPLASEKEMSISEILSLHPKGIEYSSLMEGLDSFPIILDSNDEVISFPPIINGARTTVNEGTTDFFIDVTGFDERACEACLLLVCLSLSELGGAVESVEITSWDGKVRTTPNFENRNHRVPNRLIEKILGMKLSDEKINEAINRMGGKLIESRTITDGSERQERWSDCVVGEREHVFLMPRWRSDIMHPIDIVEDIAIGYGYGNLPEVLSSIHIDSTPLGSSNLHRRIRMSMRGVGLQEIQSLTLSNERDQFEKTNWSPVSKVTTISNPISVDHTLLRQFIFPSLMNILASNRHHELPQKVYELGEVVHDGENMSKMSWACAEVGAGFSAAKGIVQSLLRDLGADDSSVSFRDVVVDSGPWISGRGAKVFIGDNQIGEFGEVSPEVIQSFGIRTPIHAGEFDVGIISDSISDPLQ
tara:strand:+ start:3501 stop:5255 length:1755 start_codon:yes stop_codon:yes gene_type:complete